MKKIYGIIRDYYLHPLIDSVISGSILKQTLKAADFPRHSRKT